MSRRHGKIVGEESFLVEDVVAHAEELKTTIGRCANFCTRMERMLQYINLDS
jgi:hypothetical protein